MSGFWGLNDPTKKEFGTSNYMITEKKGYSSIFDAWLVKFTESGRVKILYKTDVKEIHYAPGQAKVVA